MTDWSVILSMPFTLHRRKKGHHFSTTSTTRYNTLLITSLGYTSRPSDTKKKEEEEEFESKRLQMYCTVIILLSMFRLRFLIKERNWKYKGELIVVK
jgi:hypothetical protein